MTPEELREALTGESERVEWKQSASDTTDILHAACALANDLGDSRRPGYLVIGVSNNGSVVGLQENPDQAQQKLANRLSSTRLLPTPSYNIEPVEKDDKVILIVRIEPYPVPPVVRVDGSVWVRTGTVTQRARDADLLRLQERRPEHRQPFDYRLLPGATLEDIRLSALLRSMYEAAKEGDHDPESFPEIGSWLTQRGIRRSPAGWWSSAM